MQKIIKDIEKIKERDDIGEEYVKYVKEFFFELYAALEDNIDINKFSLEKYGYIVILDNSNDILYLSNVGLSKKHGGLLVNFPEDMETMDLDNGIKLYKIEILYDNEYMQFFFIREECCDKMTKKWIESNI